MMRERSVCSCGLWSFWRFGEMASVSGVLQWKGRYGLFRKYRRKKFRRECCSFSDSIWSAQTFARMDEEPTESLFARIKKKLTNM